MDALQQESDLLRRKYRWALNSGNYVEFLIPVVVTISEILTTPNLIPVKGKPYCFDFPQTIPGILNSGSGNDFRNLHFFFNSGN